MGSNADPLSIATEKTIISPVSGKEQGLVFEKPASTSEETVAIVDGDEIKESDYTEEEYKKLLRKIDRFLLPLMVYSVVFQFKIFVSLLTKASGFATAYSRRTRPHSEHKRSLVCETIPISLVNSTLGSPQSSTLPILRASSRVTSYFKDGLSESLCLSTCYVGVGR